MIYRHYPATISVETVLGCNARCVMCSVKEWEREHGLMPDDVFDAVVDQLTDFRPELKSVALFLDGEPLIDRYLEDRIARLNAAGIPQVGFTTNGSLLNPDRIRTILAAEPRWVVFSFDSLNKETYEKIRVRLKFDRVLNNILEFIDTRNLMGAGTRIVIRFIEQDFNAGEFEDYFSFFAPRLDNDRDEIHSHATHNWSMGDAAGSHGNTPCGHLDNRFVIFRNGDVPICCTDFNGHHQMGNILERHILDIFNDPQWEMYRRIHEQGRRDKMPICATCDIPELNKQGKLSLKLTPDGRTLSADALTAFDNDEKRAAAG